MSLITDAIFVKALRSNAALIASLPAGDVYNTAIALPDEDADNAPLPYVIVSFDGLNNQDTTKDNDYDGLTDTVTIGIEIAAETRPQLGELAVMIRKTIAGQKRRNKSKSSSPSQAMPHPNPPSSSAPRAVRNLTSSSKT